MKMTTGKRKKMLMVMLRIKKIRNRRMRTRVTAKMRRGTAKRRKSSRQTKRRKRLVRTIDLPNKTEDIRGFGVLGFWGSGFKVSGFGFRV